MRQNLIKQGYRKCKRLFLRLRIFLAHRHKQRRGVLIQLPYTHRIDAWLLLLRKIKRYHRRGYQVRVSLWQLNISNQIIEGYKQRVFYIAKLRRQGIAQNIERYDAAICLVLDEILKRVHLTV